MAGCLLTAHSLATCSGSPFMCTARPATGPPPALPHWIPLVCFRTPSLLPVKKGGIYVSPIPQGGGQWSS